MTVDSNLNLTDISLGVFLFSDSRLDTSNGMIQRKQSLREIIIVLKLTLNPTKQHVRPSSEV